MNVLSLVKHAKVGTKLSAAIFILVSVMFSAFALFATQQSSALLVDQAKTDIAAGTHAINMMVETFERSHQNEAKRVARQLTSYFNGAFRVDPGQMISSGALSAPALYQDETLLNNNEVLPDRFTTMSGAVDTLFVKQGSEFIRVSTSLRKEDGKRAIGTALDHAHPGYQVLLEGRSYTGPATLYGRQYMTSYEPVKDSKGSVLAVLFVGVDITDDTNDMKQRISATHLGSTGFYLALRKTPGNAPMTLIAHPNLAQYSADGEALGNLLKSRDDTDPLTTMRNTPQGTFRFIKSTDSRIIPGNVGDTLIGAWEANSNRPWIILGVVPESEMIAAASALRNRILLAGALGAVVIGILLFRMIHSMISVPLTAVYQGARSLAEGDLRLRLNSQRQDDVGAVLTAFDGIGEGLTRVIGNVRMGTAEVARAAEEIATGNADLSRRTEEQASSLAATTVSLHQLATALKSNIEQTVIAHDLAEKATGHASQGSEVISKMSTTMTDIEHHALKVADIISVVESIAFQTNILALNAAVEAARAGEQGRGFAVVATEVRALAQRSSNAAREIRDLIHTSVDGITNGCSFAAQAQNTMSSLRNAVDEVSGILKNVSAQAQVQRSGIDALSHSMTDLDSLTQQNAALVEESAAAADSLNQQSTHLRSAASVFQLPETSGMGH